jgi:hypothetical protein
MNRGRPTRLGIGLLVIVLAGLVIGGLVWLGGAIFSNGQDQTVESDNLNAGQRLLESPTDKTAVRLTVRGPIVAKEQHYSIALTINASRRSLLIFRGYDGEIMATTDFDNNRAAFDDLLAALNRAGMMNSTTEGTNDNAGVCAIGQLIQFEVLDDDKTAKKLWTTSCVGIEGNFDGLAANVVDLFLRQVPGGRGLIDQAKMTLDQDRIESNLEALD